MPEIFSDSSDSLSVDALRAAREIAEFESMWWGPSRARDKGFGAEGLTELTPDRRLAYIAFRNAFYEMTEGVVPPTRDSAEATMELFCENPELTNATLGRIDMQGDWTAAAVFERELFSIMGNVYESGYKAIRTIPPGSPEAHPIITVRAGLTELPGYVALRRKRHHIIAEAMGRPQIVLDKVSMFALDINKLGVESDAAAAEVRLIVASIMFRACDWQAISLGMGNSRDDMSADDRLNLLLAERGQFLTGNQSEYAFETAIQDAQRLRNVMQRYGMTADQLHAHLYANRYPTRMHDPEAQRFIEDAIDKRNSLLTPAVTTYYVHR